MSHLGHFQRALYLDLYLDVYLKYTGSEGYNDFFNWNTKKVGLYNYNNKNKKVLYHFQKSLFSNYINIIFNINIFNVIIIIWNYAFDFKDHGHCLKELGLCNKSQFSNKYISTTKICKPLTFQTLIVWYNRSDSWKYLRCTTSWLLR